MAIERQKTFTIGEHQFVAKFPNIGQLIDLEALKQALTSNRYGVMAQSGVVSMYQALDLVDAIAFYQIVVPDVARYLDIQNYASLQLDEIQELTNAWTKVLRPWFDGVMNQLKGISAQDNGTAQSLNND